MPDSHRHFRITLEALESRLTPSDTPLSLAQPILPALTAPLVSSLPAVELHLPSVAPSANPSASGEKGPDLGPGFLLATVESILPVHASVGLLGLQVHVGTPGPLLSVGATGSGQAGSSLVEINLGDSLPPVNGKVDVGGQLAQLTSPVVQGTLALSPLTPGALPGGATAIAQPPRPAAPFVDPTLLTVVRQPAFQAAPSAFVAAEEGTGTSLLVSAGSQLAWTSQFIAQAELYEFTGFFAGPGSAPAGPPVSLEMALASEESFDLRDGQLVEEFAVAVATEPPTPNGEDATPAETTTDHAVMFWLMGVLTVSAGGSAYLSRPRHRDDFAPDIDPRLIPVG